MGEQQIYSARSQGELSNNDVFPVVVCAEKINWVK